MLVFFLLCTLASAKEQGFEPNNKNVPATQNPKQAMSELGLPSD